jgi:hypothetical protein
MKTPLLLGLALLASAAPAFANVTVSSPASGAQVTSPFAFIATASPCSSQPVGSIGYSFDNSSVTTMIKGTSVSAQIVGPSGVHMLHVKSWGNKGAACVTNVPISISAKTVTQSVPPVVPANAIAVKGIHTLGNWKGVFDTGTNGSADGVMTMVPNPAVSGNARQFATTYTNHGGVRYSVSFDHDRVSTNFLYDGWIYIQSPNTSIAILELDMNQTMTNGDTVIFGSSATDTRTRGTTRQTPEPRRRAKERGSTPTRPATRAVGAPIPGTTFKSATRATIRATLITKASGSMALNKISTPGLFQPPQVDGTRL